MRNLLLSLAILLFSGFPFCLQAQTDEKLSDEEIESRITRLLDIMTLEEKIGQMVIYNGFWETTGPPPVEGGAKEKYEDLKNGLVGSLLNEKGVENVRKLQEVAVNQSRMGIPLLIAYDDIHGINTLFPIPLAEAASWDLESIEEASRQVADEASALGINWTLGPVLDVTREPRWGRIMEGAGEDPYLASQVAIARVKGLQGEDLSANNTIAACAKHFAGYGFVEAGLEYNITDIGSSTLYNVALPPFKAAVDRGIATVMSGFNVLNGIPIVAEKSLQKDLLKDTWGFEGFVVSDWGTIKELNTHGFSRDLLHGTELAIDAGLDMDMESNAYKSHLPDLVKSGKLDEAVIDEAARKILRLKFKLGLMEDPYRYCVPGRTQAENFEKDKRDQALEVAVKCPVLLKNENQLLPLDPKKRTKIAVIGQLAADKDGPLGSWRIGSQDSTAISVVEGIAEYTDRYTYAKGPELFVKSPTFLFKTVVNETDTSGIAEAVKVAKKADVVVMVLGEHGFQSGEAKSRTRLDFPGLQQELLEAVYKVNPNIILVVMSGRPLVLTWADEHIPSILQAWQLGTMSGRAIAKLLFGEAIPSGKLPVTFPKSLGQVPIYYNHYATGRRDPIPGGIVFYTHYSDESTAPLYPFGHGLSYTTFEYSSLKVEDDRTIEDQIRVSCYLQNTGDSDGTEIVQLYIRDRVAGVTRPVKELKGFKKVEVSAGALVRVEFTLKKNELGFYNNQGEWVVEPGEFEIMVGGDSENLLRAEYMLR